MKMHAVLASVALALAGSAFAAGDKHDHAHEHKPLHGGVGVLSDAPGALGVAHVLKILREELEVAMALTGCARLGDVGPQVLWRE